MVFKSGMFQIDPKMTPDQVANKRAMIAALLPKFGSAKYVGEGIGQLATGVMAASWTKSRAMALLRRIPCGNA